MNDSDRKTRPPVQLSDRFLGCLLGQAIGDALAAPFEGVPPEAIYYQFGLARKIVDSPPIDQLVYTDDTQMMICVAETLAACGRIDDKHLCNAFATDYEPARGYGPGARKILAAMARNEDWREVARTIFPGGSLGNGAAMRAAPVGLFFHDDLDRTWNEARLAALPTHVHPIGIEGAQLIALAVALALRSPQLDRSDFYAQLLRRAATEEFQHQLNLAAELDPDGSVAQFGNDMKAHASVVTAIACFTQAPLSYADAIARAISLGGDCDTIAAMAGAISGAHLGLAALPPKLLDRLENGKKGRDYLVQLAMNLWSKSPSVTR